MISSYPGSSVPNVSDHTGAEIVSSGEVWAGHHATQAPCASFPWTKFDWLIWFVTLSRQYPGYDSVGYSKYLTNRSFGDSFIEETKRLLVWMLPIFSYAPKMLMQHVAPDRCLRLHKAPQILVLISI